MKVNSIFNKLNSKWLFLLICLILIFLNFNYLYKSPYVVFGIADLILLFYITTLFDNKFKYLLFLHIPIVIILSNFFVTPFLELGDGIAYEATVKSYYNSNSGSFDFTNLLEDNNLLQLFKLTSFGFLPIYLIPEYFFSRPDDVVYYLWQNNFHVLLSSLVITLATSWKLQNKKYLLIIILFIILSPSFFDLTSQPTRHVVTFFSIFLLFFSYVAVLDKPKPSRIFWFIISIFFLLLSKYFLLITFLIFVLVDFHFFRIISKKIILFLIGLIISTSIIFSTLISALKDYWEIGKSGGGAFSGLLEIPIIGLILKYLYAILSPFPWSYYTYFISFNYGGNYLLFIMHIFSSLIGLYLFISVLSNYKEIFRLEKSLKLMIVYGLVMSLSILGGSAGFHTYLLIYFPFLSPLFIKKKFHINIIIPLTLITLLEAIIFIAKS